MDRIDRNTEALRHQGEAIRAPQAEIREFRRDFQAALARIDRRMDSFDRRLDTLGARWGLQSEEAFREGMCEVLSTLLPGCTVRRWRTHDQAGKVFGTSIWIEVDIAVENGRIVLVDVR